MHRWESLNDVHTCICSSLKWRLFNPHVLGGQGSTTDISAFFGLTYMDIWIPGMKAGFQHCGRLQAVQEMSSLSTGLLEQVFNSLTFRHSQALEWRRPHALKSVIHHSSWERNGRLSVINTIIKDRSHYNNHNCISSIHTKKNNIYVRI